MSYLLDTHILIWLFEGNENFSRRAREILFDSGNQFLVSIISLWEVAIKMNIGKYTFDGGFSRFYELVNENEFDILPVGKEHMEWLFKLPLHHRDPFDRLLVSTAIAEGLTIVSSDENIRRYDVSWIW